MSLEDRLIIKTYRNLFWLYVGQEITAEELDRRLTALQSKQLKLFSEEEDGNKRQADCTSAVLQKSPSG